MLNINWIELLVVVISGVLPKKQTRVGTVLVEEGIFWPLGFLTLGRRLYYQGAVFSF